jgi:hypothetical protein
VRKRGFCPVHGRGFLVAVGVMDFFQPGPGVLMVGAVVFGVGLLPAFIAKRINSNRIERQQPDKY